MKILIAVLSIAMIAAADSSVMFEFPDGRTVALTSTADLSMAAESVSISPAEGPHSPYDLGWDWLPMMDVRCVFYLVNLTDASQDVTVGFPLDARFGDAYTTMTDSMLVAMFDSLYADEERKPWFETGPSEGSDASDLVPPELRFRAEVDGEPVDVFYRTCAWSLDDSMIWGPVMAVWRMSFAPGDTVRLVNSYRTSWDYSSGGPDAWYRMAYIVTTGANWSGTIGSAVITMEVPGILAVPQWNDTLVASWSWTGAPVVDEASRTLVWEYRDWEPMENLELTIRTFGEGGYWYETVDPFEMARMITWTGDSLLASAQAFITGRLTWIDRLHALHLLHIVQDVHAVVEGVEPPHPEAMSYFDLSVAGGALPSRLDASVIGEVERRIESDMATADETGYLRFLPMLILMNPRMPWDPDMYAAMPEVQERYHGLLQALAAAGKGLPTGDPAADALFRLACLQ